jgi:hypothetical protein
MLLDVTLPEELLPHGEKREAALIPVSVAPGTSGQWTANAGDSNPGLRVTYVLAGTITVQVKGPAELIRFGHAPASVAAGAEVALEPDDALIGRVETAFAYANVGTEAVELMSWTLTDHSTNTVPVPEGWAFPHNRSHMGIVSVPQGSLRLRLRRVDLAEGGAVPAPAAGGLQFAAPLAANQAGTPVAGVLGNTSDGAIRNLGKEAITLYVLTLEPAGGDEGTPMPAARTT